MQAQFSREFSKQYDKAPQKIRRAFETRLVLFLKDEKHPLLNTHTLLGRYKNHESINITGDWRAVYSERDAGKVAYFVALGKHS